MAGHPALARVPVAGGEVVQHLGEAVLVESRPQVFLVIVVGKQILDAPESRIGGGAEAVHEGDLVEHHRQIGSKFRHVFLAV